MFYLGLWTSGSQELCHREEGLARGCVLLLPLGSLGNNTAWRPGDSAGSVMDSLCDLGKKTPTADFSVFFVKEKWEVGRAGRKVT